MLKVYAETKGGKGGGTRTTTTAPKRGGLRGTVTNAIGAATRRIRGGK